MFYDHFVDFHEKVILVLAEVDSFLIDFDVIHKIDVWGFRAKGGEFTHRNTNRSL